MVDSLRIQYLSLNLFLPSRFKGPITFIASSLDNVHRYYSEIKRTYLNF